MTASAIQANYELQQLRVANYLVKVRLSGSTYSARWGKGKAAVTATCTAGEEQAAIAVVTKHLKAQGVTDLPKLVARSRPQQGQLPGLKLKAEYGVSFLEVGLSRENGGVL